MTPKKDIEPIERYLRHFIIDEFVIETSLEEDIKAVKHYCWNMEKFFEDSLKGTYPDLEEIFRVANNNKRTLVRRQKIFELLKKKAIEDGVELSLIKMPKNMKELLIEMEGLVYYIRRCYVIFWLRAGEKGLDFG